MKKQFFKQTNNYDLAYLRKAKADAMEEIYKKGILQRDDLRVEKYEQATVLPCSLNVNGDKWRECMAGVVRQDGMIVPISCTWPFTKISYTIDNKIYLDKNVIYIGSFRNHWGHFLIDLVPRLWYLLEGGRDEADLYVISGEFNGDTEIQIANVREFLRLLGILDKTKVVNIPTKFRTVTIPERAYYYGKAINDSCERHVFSNKYIAVFNYITKKALEACEENTNGEIFPEKVFMTRKTYIDYGIELLNRFFEKNDYLVFDPAEATLTELIMLLNKCERIAYVSGTLQHNMMFAPNGMPAIAIESRTYVSPVQMDIDIMKDIQVTYIDANYSIVKDFWHFARLYGYTSYFKQYVKDTEKKEPDAFFQSQDYLLKNVEKYLRSYQLPFASTFRYCEDDYSGYEIEVYQESVSEIANELGTTIRIKYIENYDRKSVIEETSELLECLKIPYSKWREDTYSNKYLTFCDLIKYALQKKEVKRFMIFPYGGNGLLCKLILKEVFDKEPIVFDNRLCQYTASVFPLSKIEQMKESGDIMILTSSKEECFKEIENYFDTQMVIGPYTVY